MCRVAFPTLRPLSAASWISLVPRAISRKLYYNPRIIGEASIQPTDGVLSQDASFVVRIEGGEPIFVTVHAKDTDGSAQREDGTPVAPANASIDDLIDDVNRAIQEALESANLGEALADRSTGPLLIAERLTPYEGNQISIAPAPAPLIGGPIAPLPAQTYKRFEVTFKDEVNLFNLGIRVGDVVDYLDLDGRRQKATIDDLGTDKVTFRFDGATQAAPQTNDSRLISFFDEADENKLTIRTADPTVGISLDMSTVQVTARGDAPSSGQLAASDVQIEFTVDVLGSAEPTIARLSIDGTKLSTDDTIDGRTFSVDIDDNFEAADLANDLNRVLEKTSVGQQIKVVLVGSVLRVAAIDGTVHSLTVGGAEKLGFTNNQEIDSHEHGAPDHNEHEHEHGETKETSENGGTGAQQLGLARHASAGAVFRVNTIQDLVHTLNGLLNSQIEGAPVQAALRYDQVTKSIAFSVGISAEFEEKIRLDFGSSLDIGFTDLSIAGGADANFSAIAGVELGIGIDLGNGGSSKTVTGDTPLQSLAGGKGAAFNIGITAADHVKEGSPGGPLKLPFELELLGGTQISGLGIELPSSATASITSDDNTDISDLAADLNQLLVQLFESDPRLSGLAIVDGIPPVEVQVEGRDLRLVGHDRSINRLRIAGTPSSFLGFAANQTSNEADLMITYGNTTAKLPLDGFNTLGEVAEAIEFATGGTVKVSYAGDQIVLSHTPKVAGAIATLIVEATSPMAQALGISGAPINDPETPQDESSTITGTPLFTPTLLERFYVQENSRVFANATVTASDIDLTASLGILDIGIVDGWLDFAVDVELGLKDPSTDGKIRFHEFSSSGFSDILEPTFSYGRSDGDRTKPNLLLPVGGSLIELLPADSPAVAIEVAFRNQPGSLKPEFEFKTDGFKDLVGSFKDLSLADLANVLQNVVTLLQDSDIEGLNTPIPVINKTPNELLDVVDGLANAAEDLLRGPDTNVLRDLANQIETALQRLVGSADELRRVTDAFEAFRSALGSAPEKSVSLQFDAQAGQTQTFVLTAPPATDATINVNLVAEGKTHSFGLDAPEVKLVGGETKLTLTPTQDGRVEIEYTAMPPSASVNPDQTFTLQLNDSAGNTLIETAEISQAASAAELLDALQTQTDTFDVVFGDSLSVTLTRPVSAANAAFVLTYLSNGQTERWASNHPLVKYDALTKVTRLQFTPKQTGKLTVRYATDQYVESVTLDKSAQSQDSGGPFRITFSDSLQNTEELIARSATGLTASVRTESEGSAQAGETQVLSFVSAGNVNTTIGEFHQVVSELPEMGGREELVGLVDQLKDSIATGSGLGKYIEGLIEGALGIEEDLFSLDLSFVDANSNTEGLQPAVLIEIGLQKEIRQELDFDFAVPDLGPITVESGAKLEFEVGGKLDLDFGFNFDSFTPYILDTTKLELTAGVPQGQIDVQAGIGGIEAGLAGNLRLLASTSESVPTGQTRYAMSENPLERLVVVSAGGVVLTRGQDNDASTLKPAGSADYILEYSSGQQTPPRLRFAVATQASTEVQFLTSQSSDPASISVGINKEAFDAAGGDGNTVGGIPFRQFFKSPPAMKDKLAIDVDGIVLASLDGKLAGFEADNAITVISRVDQLKPEFRFDGVKNFFENLSFDPKKLSLKQIISGTTAVLDKIKTGLQSDLLEQLPLIGSGVDLSNTFIGRLEGLVSKLETVVDGASDKLNEIKEQMQTLIFDNLGPQGANILAPSIQSSGDIDIVIPDLNSTAEDAEFRINLHLMGSDTFDVDFDLGVDALVFEFETAGGVEIKWDYDFEFGIGINMVDGFFFQLKDEANYVGDFPAPGQSEISLNAEVSLKDGTSLRAELFFLNVMAASNALEDFNRDGVVNDGQMIGEIDENGFLHGPVLDEVADNRDYNGDNQIVGTVVESVGEDGRFSKGTGLTGQIFIDFKDPGTGEQLDGRLTFGELRSTPFKELFDAGISTTAFVDLHLTADTAAASLPKVTADLTMDWAIGYTTSAGLVGGGVPDLVIHDVTLDLASFFDAVIDPVFDNFRKYVDPIKPTIDFLASEVPGLSDISKKVGNGAVTFLDLASLANPAVGMQAKRAVGLVQSVYAFIDEIEELGSDSGGASINFGTFYVTGMPEDVGIKEPEKAEVKGSTTTKARPHVELNQIPRSGQPVRVFVDDGTAQRELSRREFGVVSEKDDQTKTTKSRIEFFDARTGKATSIAGEIRVAYVTTAGGAMDLTDENAQVKVKDDMLQPKEMEPKTPATANPSQKAKAKKGKSTLNKLKRPADGNGAGGFGINIPLLSDPSLAFKLFTGETIDIIQWDIPRLELSVPFNKKFGPIVPVVPLFATIGAQFDAFLDLSIGFDTRGIAKTDNFADGFYFGDLEDVSTGDDIDEFGFGLQVSVGAELNLGIASAGVEAGIKADIGFNWNDLDGNGKIYFDELGRLFTLQPTPRPAKPIPGVCVFDVHGSLDAFLRFTYSALFVSGSIDIIDVNLFKFEHSCPGNAVVPAELSAGDERFAAGTLVLNSGEFAERRDPGRSQDDGEVFRIRQIDPGDPIDVVTETTIEVSYDLDTGEEKPLTITRRYTGVEKIFVDGGAGDDRIEMDASVQTPVVLIGGAGNDVLIGGSGNDILVGGLGNDQLVGNAGSDRYVFENAWGIDTVEEIDSAERDEDHFDFSALTEPITATVDRATATSGINTVRGALTEAGEEKAITGIEVIIGGNAADTLTVSADAEANTWNVSGRNAGNLNGGVGFKDFENLTGGALDDLFVFGNGASVDGKIDGGSGDNSLNYHAYQSPIRIDREKASATATGGFINIQFAVGGQTEDDEIVGRNVASQWTIATDKSGFIGDGDTAPPQDFRFEAIERLVGGIENDEVDMSAENVPLTFAISGVNQGSIHSPARLFSFTGIEDLRAGTASDQFVFAPQAGMSGRILGGAGSEDHLDYSAWTTPVFVDLGQNANHIGKVFEVENVTGGQGDDEIKGDGQRNLLVGGFGNDLLDGGDGNDVLFGGFAIGSLADFANSADFELPPNYRLVEDAYSSNPENFGLPVSAGDAIDNANRHWPPLISPKIVGGLSVAGRIDDGRDRLIGGAGQDHLFGGSDSDVLIGGDGADYLDGGAGNDATLQGGPGNDIVRGGTGADNLDGGEGIDQLFGDDGDDILFGGPGAVDPVSGARRLAGQRLFGGAGRDQLVAFSYTTGTDPVQLAGDQLFGGPGDDELLGGSYRELLVGDGGNDILRGGLANDRLLGGSGEDELSGGIGDDEIWGGADSDLIDGQQGADKQYGGSGIDKFIVWTTADCGNGTFCVDTIDGHYGNEIKGDVSQDNATDILVIDGTSANDTILLGENVDEQDPTLNGQLAIFYQAGGQPPRRIVVNVIAQNDTPLVEQFLISGLAGDDTLGFVSVSQFPAELNNTPYPAVATVAGLIPLDVSKFSAGRRDYVGVLSGNSGNDVLLGSPGRDQLDGGIGSDVAYGLQGDDRIWGDRGEGTSVDHDALFAGQGNDDLVGGQGTNELYAWSFDPDTTTITQLGFEPGLKAVKGADGILRIQAANPAPRNGRLRRCHLWHSS